jgi:dipeptidyl-peptidase-4
MKILPRCFVPLAALAFSIHAADDANSKYFRDLAETRNFSLGQPVAPTLTPDGRTVIYLRGGPRDPVLRLYEFPLPAGPERELLTPA